jgi:hypothetical protein
MTDRAARDYLTSSGASAISIVEGEAGCVFRTGAMAAQVAGVPVHATYWVSANLATAIARRARKIAGARSPFRNGGSGNIPDVATATQALAQAAADLRVKLTPNDVAIERARNAAIKLDAYLAGRGMLRDFNAEYRRRREAAGGRFMSYGAAQTRLRRALIPMLANGGTIGPRSLFEQIFGR